MSLPFNSYNQLRYRGNEYVTDQTLNRTVYRLFQNDVYLDRTVQEHINDASVHYSEPDSVYIDYLTSDKLVVLPAEPIENSTTKYKESEDVIINNNYYISKTWQRLVDEQPKNIGGNTLIFRFQQAKNVSSNPNSEKTIELKSMLKFSNFYGGTLIIESPAAYNINDYQTDINGYRNNSTYDINRQSIKSCLNQHLTLVRNNGISIIDVENCHCKVIIRNTSFLVQSLSGITDLSNNDSENDFRYKLNADGSFNSDDYDVDKLYRNNKSSGDTDGDNEIKFYSSRFDKWFDSNMISAIKITDSPDVLIKHCYIRY